MTQRVRVAVLCAVLAAGAAGCGQQGPLTLPESARPIERIEQPSADPERNEDERQDER
jgi:predicted small lipoprotein YifL